MMQTVSNEPIRWISGIILAAGGSKRLGQPKQLLELDGKILLQHVVDAAVGAGLDEIVVVLGHRAEVIQAALALPSNARVVTNPGYMDGQSTSLRVGLDAVDPRTDAVAILLGDQPRLRAEAIRNALEAFRASGSLVLRCVWQGTPGHPVFVARSEWDSLREVTGDKGARDIIARSAHVEEMEMGEAAVADVDTWEQYRAIGGVVPGESANP